MAGLDWVRFRFRDVESGRKISTTGLAKLKFSSVAWRKDGTGFYYSRYTDDAPDEGPEQSRAVSYQVYYHKMGTQQAARHTDLRLIQRSKGIQLVGFSQLG